jgi:hypothetical protein
MYILLCHSKHDSTHEGHDVANVKHSRGKDKDIPVVTGRGDPKGYERLRLPHYLLDQRLPTGGPRAESGPRQVTCLVRLVKVSMSA